MGADQWGIEGQRWPMRFLAIWILVCTVCSVAGWAFSAARVLAPWGYAILAAIGIASIARRARAELGGVIEFVRVRRRRARYQSLPSLYAAVALLTLTGAILHAPNNYDALTYRIPRLLHWFSERGWSWFATSNPRMNYSGTGAEWLMASLFALSRSDRLFFLINFIPFLLLPSLLFSVYTGLGVKKAVAWHWMWILPMAYCFTLQAGGIANDALAAVFLLAAIHFAFEARRRGDERVAWLAVLSVALLTGVKASNLPLVLPCAFALWPARDLLLRRVHVTSGVVLVAIAISFVPNAVINIHYTGSWTGDPNNLDRLQLRNPAAGIVGNSIQALAQVVQPPIAPKAGVLRDVVEKLLPERIDSSVHEAFPRFAPTVGELPQEEVAGIGIGVGLLLLISLAACAGAALRRVTPSRVGVIGAAPGSDIRSGFAVAGKKRLGNWIAAATWIACLVFMAKMGSEATARLLSPYYPLLIAPLLMSDRNARLVRSRLWQRAAFVAAASTTIAVVLSPSRPLWPAQKVLAAALASRPQNTQLLRARDVYEVYSRRHDLLDPVAAHIPPDVRTVGLIAGPDDAEAALWSPCCARRVEHLIRQSSRVDEVEPEWVVGTTTALLSRFGPLDIWLRTSGRQLVAVESIRGKVSSPPKLWFIARLEPNARFRP